MIMPLEISYGDFDTVCFSNQHNIIELINHVINMGVQININIGSIENLQNDLSDVKEDVENGTEDIDDIARRLNSLQLDLNDLERHLTVLTQEYNTFSYAVTTDLGVLKNRVDALEQKVG